MGTYDTELCVFHAGTMVMNGSPKATQPCLVTDNSKPRSCARGGAPRAHIWMICSPHAQRRRRLVHAGTWSGLTEALLQVCEDFCKASVCESALLNTCTSPHLTNPPIGP